MRVEELLESIKQLNGAAETCLCEIKSKCISYDSCGKHSNTAIIDFDHVAVQFSKNTRQATVPSVDGVCTNGKNNILILVEKKSWSRFFFPSDNVFGKDSLSDIDEQLTRYDLASKYKNTCEIIASTIDEPNVLARTNHAFVLVTDINLVAPNEKNDPGAGFLETLLMIGYSSNKIVPQELFDYTKNNTLSLLNQIGSVDVYYVDCYDFDHYIYNEI